MLYLPLALLFLEISLKIIFSTINLNTHALLGYKYPILLRLQILLRCRTGILSLKMGLKRLRCLLPACFFGWCLKPSLQLQGHSDSTEFRLEITAGLDTWTATSISGWLPWWALAAAPCWQSSSLWQTASGRGGPPSPAVCSQTANSHVPKAPSERATLWPSVSECLNLVVIDLGPPPQTQISERAVT